MILTSIAAMANGRDAMVNGQDAMVNGQELCRDGGGVAAAALCLTSHP